MIEFRGELSYKCKRFFQKKITKVASLSALISLLAVSIPIIILALTWNWICFLLIPALSLIVVFASIPKVNAPMKLLNSLFPKIISIADEEIALESESGFQISPIEKIKKVIDFGEWYQLIFYMGYRGYFICQKNLIVKGTIKEFEKLFEGKIELRKIKNEGN